MMKKLILSSLAVLGLSVAFVAPAKAQVLVNSTPAGGSITGAASFTNFNGSTSAIAGEVTFPTNVYAEDVVVTLTTPTALPSTGEVVLEVLTVSQSAAATVITPTTGTSVEAAVATLISTPAGITDLDGQVSIIRAWTAGGLD